MVLGPEGWDGSVGKGASLQAQRPSSTPGTLSRQGTERTHPGKGVIYGVCTHPPTLNEYKPHPLWEAIVPPRRAHDSCLKDQQAQVYSSLGFRERGPRG